MMIQFCRQGAPVTMLDLQHRYAVILVCMLLLACGGCGGSGATTSPSSTSLAGQPSAITVSERQRNAVLQFWAAEHAFVVNPDISPGEAPYDAARLYPSEQPVSLLAGYLITGRQDYLQDVVNLLQAAHSSETAQSFLVLPPDLAPSSVSAPVVSSLSQVRLVLGYYTAYRALHDARYLQWADDAMGALLFLPREQACWNGQCFLLFDFLYRVDTLQPVSDTFVNPNHDAFLAATATVLYFEPASRWFGNPTLAAMAQDAMGAALVMMDSGGRIPLSADGTDATQYDTNYGGITLVLAYWANQHWDDASYDRKLALGAAWLNSYTQGGVRTERYYPDVFAGFPPEPSELYYRLPLLLHYGGDLNALSAGLEQTWVTESQTTSTPEGGWSAPFPVLDAMGVPKPAYW